MWRRLLAAAILLALVAFGHGLSGQEGAEVTGQVSASEGEADEGYFAIGPETVLVVKPGSPAHRWLKDQVGRELRIVIQPRQPTY